ncbi:Flp family type IVb pilin [Roseicyclus amphidinii]|uniref:Flp family type IVb pilin n=1 Tax=Roseicyclus amphidinii TaxID=3034232 RepID=UPI0024E1473C|nr:Flp family type IVb pilin [Roseicyclus sp. Amp-Y-6]
MTHAIKTFFRTESGATAIEYGLIAAGIGVAIVAVVNGVGTSIIDNFNTVITELGGTPPE